MSNPASFDGLLSPEATDKERVFFENLLVPVNPEYDFDADPTGQFDYANPVTLNNQLVLYTNAGIELTKKVVVLNRRREKLRLDKKDVERKLKALRQNTLAKNPAPPSAAKNLALTDAYVQRCLEADGFFLEAQAHEATVATLDDKIDLMKEEAENLFFTMNTIKLASQNIMTHLSFVKNEQKMHGVGNHA